MVEIGVKAFKDDLSRYLRRASDGERILVTDRGRPIAMVTPVEELPGQTWAWTLVRDRKATWRGGKPRGLARGPKVLGASTSELVLEDRR